MTQLDALDATELRSVVDIRQTLQKMRISMTNRLSAIDRGDDQALPATVHTLESWAERFAQMEEYATNDILTTVEGIEIVDRMTAVKGVGSVLAARFVSMVNIQVPETASALWRYAGFAVIDGKSERPVKGVKLHYNKRLKTVCYIIAGSFLKSRSPYAAIYYSAREYYRENRPDWTKGHIHNASLRKMVKRWIMHVWLVWRQIEGLPVTNPYVQDMMGHTHIDSPEDYGWEPLD